MKNVTTIALLVLIAIALPGCSISYEKKPFFTGTEKLMVCKRPYSNNISCYNLNVRNNGDEAMTVFFENGGMIDLENMYCTKTIHDDDICQGKDNESNIWDVLPIETNII